MKPQIKFLKAIILTCIIIWGCSKSDDSNPNPDPDLTTFEGVIKLGGDSFEEVPQSRTTDTLETSDPQNKDIVEPILNQDGEEVGNEEVPHRYVCTTKTVSVLDGNGTFPLFNSNADVIYPGALLQGKSLENATPSPIPVKRAGGTISYDLNNGNLSSFFPVDEITKSKVQNGMNVIINGAVSAGNVVPANFQLDIVQVQSESQLALELGLKVKTFAVKAKASMTYNSSSSYNSFLVKLTQSYYTMSYDLPTSLEEIFHESVTPEKLSDYVAADNPATFISSVTYGRIFYMLVESTSSAREMEAKLNASYGKFGNSVSGSVEVDAFNSLKNNKIKVIAYGGDAKGTFELTGETSIGAIADKLAESTDIRAGLPLSYVVRSVERPDVIVGSRLATAYDVVECELKGVLPPQGYQSLVDLFADDEDGGGIGAMVQLKDSNILVYNKAGTKYAWYNGNLGEVLGMFDIHDENGPMGVTSFDSVGATVRFSNDQIYVFNQTGLQNEIFEYDPDLAAGNELSNGPIGSYRQENNANRLYAVNEIFGDSDNFQFVNRGIGAGARFNLDGEKIFFEKEGDQYALYNSSGKGSWKNPENNNELFAESNATSPLFDKVGAACYISFGGQSGRWLFINKGGDELMEYADTPSNVYDGPWVIN